MQNTSALYRQLMSNENHWFECAVVIGESGVLVNELAEKITFGGDTIIIARTGAESGFTEDRLFSVATTSRMFSGNPEIGNAVASEIDVSMINPIVDIPRMGVIIPYVRVCAEIPVDNGVTLEDNLLDVPGSYLDEDNNLVLPNARMVNGYVAFASDMQLTKSEWIQQGVFYIDTRKITHNDDGLDVLDLHGYDAMLKADQDYASTNLDFPALDIDIVAEIATKMDVPVDARTYDIMTGGYTLPLPTNYSCREILGYIASMYAGTFIMNDVGELRLVSILELPPETRYLVDKYGYAITFGGDRILV